MLKFSVNGRMSFVICDDFDTIEKAKVGAVTQKYVSILRGVVQQKGFSQSHFYPFFTYTRVSFKGGIHD